MPINSSPEVIKIPDLDFPMVEYGKLEEPWTLLPLLYSGGSAASVKNVSSAIEKGSLGPCLLERLNLIERVHQEMTDDLIAGGSRYSAKARIRVLRVVFTWADRVGADLRLETVTENYRAWTDELLYRQLVLKEIGGHTVHSFASVFSALLSPILGREYPLIKETRIRKPRGNGKFGTSAADKVNLTETFKFGHALVDICKCLSFEAIKGRLPIEVCLHTGHSLQYWSGVPKPVASFNKKNMGPSQIRGLEEKRAIRQADNSLLARSPLVNLRIEAELLLFIAQTGMNLQQAHLLQMDAFHYTSYLDGYQVRRYKERRQGVVLFEIFSEYRVHFEEYLRWRNAWFPEQKKGLLFPSIIRGRNRTSAPGFWQIISLCQKCDIPFVRPRSLRKTRVNWLLRRMSDPLQVAEIAQHDLQTLLRQYAEPHPQLAMVEISKFHAKNASHVTPPGPGSCETPTPEPLDNIPNGAPMPDCISGGGCLFCRNHRDIDSYDHIWSLVSFRYLKSLELARFIPPENSEFPPHPAEMVIQRITQKIKFFESSSEVRSIWVKESLLCIEEESYHPSWDGFIQLSEMKGGN
ncbi:hypothetical protein hmeg3_14725 [Herbaspirillum sp. meg3]|nr:hypothetical protein hmeg3_14725 [Herbaspirillum sp. meg3]